MSELNEENYLDDLLKSIKNENENEDENEETSKVVENVSNEETSGESAETEEPVEEPEKLAEQLEKLLKEVDADTDNSEVPVEADSKLEASLPHQAESETGSMNETETVASSEEPVPVSEDIPDFSSLFEQLDSAEAQAADESITEAEELDAAAVATNSDDVQKDATITDTERVVTDEVVQMEPDNETLVDNNMKAEASVNTETEPEVEKDNASLGEVAEVVEVAAVAGSAVADGLKEAEALTGAKTLDMTPGEEAAMVAKAAAELGGGTSEKGSGKKQKKESKKKDKKKKEKSNKKGVFGVIKDVFFESLEEETPEITLEEADTIQKDKINESIKPETDASKVDEPNINESKGERLSESPQSENERVIQELYGDKDENKHLDEEVAPKKGFFAKVKYRLGMLKQKNEDEDKAEQEAEAREIEEKQKKKDTKKEAAKEKSEQAKAAKAEKVAQAKEKKAAKPKKEKKPKEPPKPGDILKIKPASIIFFLLFVSGVILLVYVGNSALHYNYSVQAAQNYFESGNYEKAYDELEGVNLKGNDKSLFEQSQVIMYIQRQYDSYQNYMAINQKTDALNALVKGIQRYDDNYNNANSLGVASECDAIKKEIVSALQGDFRISEAEGRALAQLSEDNFTQYYFKIEAYGETK